MAYTDGSSKTFVSTADLSGVTGGLNGPGGTGQYLLCKIDASNAGQIVLCSASTDIALGWVMGAPVAGDITEVRLRSASGTVQAVAGATIAAGALLMSDSSGRVITATGTGNQIVGTFLCCRRWRHHRSSPFERKILNGD